MTITSFNLVKKTAPTLGVRHIQVFFLFTCCMLAFLQRINLSVGIVAMTNSHSTNPDFTEYELTEQQRSLMLSSLFWGTLFTQLLGGYLSSRYGAKHLLLYSTLGTSVAGICLPLAIAHCGWLLFCLLRLLQGLCQGFMWPSIYSHLAKWCPTEERNLLGGITQTGMDVGTALGFALSGLLAASSLGWPSMFYVPGAFGIIWSFLWLIYGANSPAECNIITLDERKRIEQRLNPPQSNNGHSPVPWCAILTSVPYLVLALVKMSQASSYHTLMQQIPTYIHGIFDYNIKVNALLSALPFAVMCCMSYVCLFTADLLMRVHSVSLAVVRKSINSFASWVPAGALVALGYISVDNVVGSVACLIVAVSAIAAQAIGSSLNHIDLSPNFAGVLFGICNTLMSAVGVISPLVVSAIVSDESDRSQWRLVFIGIAVILFVGNFLYIMFGQMVVQPWNEPSQVAERPMHAHTEAQQPQMGEQTRNEKATVTI